MANMMDYLLWRGDLRFSDVPFNEVDNLILSELAFLDFSEILSSDPSEAMLLYDVADRYFLERGDHPPNFGFVVPKEILPLFRMAAESDRFREIRLCAYEKILDSDSESQFAAVTMLIPDGSMYLAFCGTDDTLVGWKEDFNMSFLPVVPAQSLAVRYLERVAELYPDRIRLGGHSKGGNLAIYAAAKSVSAVQTRILGVYNNDGPGFSREFLDSEGYAAVKGCVRTIVPQGSLVGMLLENDSEFTIVKSRASGIFQHDGFSWEVLGKEFVRVEDRTQESKVMDRAIRVWLAGISVSEREEFVESLYAVLKSAGAETLSELMENKEALLKIVRGCKPEHVEILQKVVVSLFRERQRIVKADKNERKQERLREKEAGEQGTGKKSPPVFVSPIRIQKGPPPPPPKTS